MSMRFSAPTHEARLAWFLVLLACTGVLVVPATGADRVVLGEEFSNAG